MIEVGKMAPDFELEDHNGEMVKLSDLKGEKVVIGWHPLAWTSVCTDQMRDLERNFEKMAEKGVGTVLGVSVDAVPCKKVWATALGIENIKLVSDFEPKGEMSQAYDIWINKIGASGRGTVVIDEESKIIYAKEEDISELPDMEEILKALD